ncbi:polysaccharide deacetylase family protein [Methanogenium sp. MK-MG]|uniref:polysaccharide deacetylase family protein n=1 Tax=Methanogenium sp. MK-MG TaxID=2599926 RepID=UPI0013EA7880|nr:polysaccharide deacetylase family protein [Methanogenium sp. MK-MG]
MSVQPTGRPDSGVCIGYEAEGRGLFSVAVVQNTALEEHAGEIAIHNQTYPLFQVPADTREAGDTCIAEFRSDDRKYPCISGSKSGIAIGFDLFRLTGSLLSGYLDKTEVRHKSAQNQSVFSPPLVDLYEDILFRAILTGCGEIGMPLVRKSHWPSGKEFAVCLTHDVDEFTKTYQWVTRPMRFLRKRNFYGIKNQMKSLSRRFRGHEPYWTFEEMMRNEKKLGVRSTYFFLKESGKKSLFRPESWHLYGRCHSLQKPRVIGLIQKLSEDGHEIGVHGSTFSHNNPTLLNQEKKEIEELLGQNVTGIRQHRLNLTIPDTWEYQSEAGFLYDTSLGYKAADGRGFRWGTCLPFHPHAATGMLPLLEIPLSLMDITLQDEENGWNVCSSAIEQVRNMGGLLTLLWHPAVFNDLEYPGLGDWYWRIIQRCKEDDAWLTTGQEIASWWQAREATAFDWRYTEDELSVTGDFSGGGSFDVYVPEHKTAELISENATLAEVKKDHYLLCPDGDDVSNEILVRLR